MYQLNTNGVVQRLSDGAFIPFSTDNRDYEEYLQWLGSGNTALPVVVPDSASLLKQGEVAIQQALDSMARTRGYDDIKSACAYASSTPVVSEDSPLFQRCEKFRTEGNSLQCWMALTWAQAYEYLELVAQGQQAVPTPEEAVAMMPEFTWPA